MEKNNLLKIGSKEWIKIFQESAIKMGISLDSNQMEKFCYFGNELLNWNKTHNLTSITDPIDVIAKHFLDSLVLSAYINSGKNQIEPNEDMQILDVGSGAGFPGIPLAILFPNTLFTLIDSSRKKVSFLKYTKACLNLNNISVLNMRIEDLKYNKKYHNFFFMIISRAFLSINLFVPLVNTLVKDNGKIIAMKAEKAEQELQKFSKKDFYNISQKKYRLPLINQERIILCFNLKKQRVCQG